MMLKKTTVNNLIKTMTAEMYDAFNLNITGENEETLFSVDGENVLKTLSGLYGTWCFVYESDNIFPGDVAHPLSDFLAAWNLFCYDNLPNLTNILKAYTEEYKPLENYRMEEEHTAASTWGKTHTDTGAETTETEIHTNNTTTTEIDDDNPVTDTQYSTTYDDTVNNRKTGESVSTGTTSTHNITAPDVDGVAQNRTKVSKSFDGHGYTESGTDSTTLDKTTRSGNIGVTTSQQMLQSELDVRRFTPLRFFIDKFAHDTLILSTGGDNGEHYFI